MAARNYRDLIVWRKAMDLVVGAYELTRVFPKEEMYGLTGQLRRAAVSVPANIAEGQGRGTKMEFARFLRIAHGSLREVETHVLLAGRLELASAETYQPVLALAEEVGRLINGLLNSLKR